MRGDANTAEIESVGIPASLDRRIGFGESIGMKAAGFVEKFKAPVIEMHERTSQCPCKIPSPLSVSVVDLLILTP